MKFMRLKNLILALVFFSLTSFARAEQLYVISYIGNTIDAYNTDGTPVSVPLVNGTGLDWAYSMTTDGTYLYAGNIGNDAYTGSISKYALDGTAVSPFMITGIALPTQIVANGGYLYTVNYIDGTVSKYTTTGTLVNASLISGLSGGEALAIDDSGNIYVAEYFNNTILKYDSSGTLLNGSLITGIDGPEGLAYHDGFLYVSNFTGNTIGKYGIDGTVIDADLITGLGGPFKVGFDGDDNLYVANRTSGTIGKYLLDGTAVNPNLITGLESPSAVVVAPSPVPEPSTYALALLGLAALGLTLRRRA